MTLASAPYRRAVLTLIITRLAFAALLVGGAILSGFQKGSMSAEQPLTNTGITTLALTVLYLILFPRFGASGGFAMAQLALDAATVAWLTLLTGGAQSIFVVLHFVILLTGALMLERDRVLRLLAAVICLHGLLTVGISLQWRPLQRFISAGDVLPPAQLYYLLLLHLTGFILVTTMGIRLAGRVRLANLALAAAERTFADYRLFADALVSGITDSVLALSRDGSVVFANEEAQRRFGEALGRPLEAVIPELSAGEITQRVALYGSTTIDLLPSAGRPHHYELHAFPLGGEGGRVGTALILRDVTNFKKLQAELKFKENLAALGQLSARIAHEIRNPLAAISGAAQMLHAQSSEPGPQQLMGVIVSETERLSGVLGDFLKYTRPQAIHPERADLRRLVQETLTLAAQEPGPRLMQDLPEAPLIGPMDADRVRQVLWNLISNARKASPDGGEIRIELTRLEGGEAALAVEDQGPGVPEAKRAEIFSPFYFGFHEGSGLGLAIAHKIAEGHGGRLEIQDARHGPHGARFVLSLPGFHSEAATAGDSMETA
jgi:two-component system sensor histidine kinase PilS (NtrC family)